jgi:hypothetical protein
MSGKRPKPPDFLKADPDSEGLRRVYVNWAQTAPVDAVIETFSRAHRGGKLAPNNRAGKVGRETEHIRALVAAHPNLAFKPKKLRAHGDGKILKNMDEGTFGNRVRDARKFHGIAKP